jgi:hypothetical protein
MIAPSRRKTILFSAAAAFTPLLQMAWQTSAQDAPAQKKKAVTKKAAPATPSTIESDARRALGKECSASDPSGRLSPWLMCLTALDFATQPQPKYSDALATLTIGYDASPPKYPYAVSPGYADKFWDWLAGAVRNEADLKETAKLNAAIATAKRYVGNYYNFDNRGLMDTVDANFAGGNPRRAIFELLEFASQGMPDLDKRTAAAQNSAHILSLDANARADSARRAADLRKTLDGLIDSQVPQASRPALKAPLQDAEGIAANLPRQAQSNAGDASKNATNLKSDLNRRLSDLEQIRLCYATGSNGSTLNYRDKLVQYVSEKSHPASK